MGDLDGNGKITATDLEYSISVKNKENANGIFIWKKIDSEDFISTYNDFVTTNIYSMGKDKKEDIFQVFVKNQDQINKNVNIVVELNAKQKNMNETNI